MIAPLPTLLRRLGIEPHERTTLVLMGLLITVLLGAYTIAKVQRDAMFLSEFGALTLPYAYLGVAVVSAGFVWLEGRVARRYPRAALGPLHRYIAIGFSVLAALLFPVAPHWTAALFYLWTGSQAMMLLPHFWVLAMDVWDSRRARRLFPVLTGCGLIGGILGGAAAGWVVPVASSIGLPWLLAFLLVATHLLALAVERRRPRRPSPAEIATSTSRWEIVRRSPYIKILAIALALSVMVATLVDFQFKFFVQSAYPDAHAMSRFLGRFYFVLNALALPLQFGVAGWILTRFGLGISTALQPASILALSAWVAVSTGWWMVIAMRWVQGIFVQTLGKSSTEIYYMAVPPPERRRIKPAIDTLVERWSDAVVGILLIFLLRAAGVLISAVAVATAVMAAVWLLLLLRLNRYHARAFEEALSSRWIEPEGAAESMRIPAARRALIRALRSGEERSIVLALRLARQARHPQIAQAVRESLRHSSPAVREAAVETMEALRLRDRQGIIEGLLLDPSESLRRAAVQYLLVMSPTPVEFARRLLDGTDSSLGRILVDVLLECPHEAPSAITADWIDARLRTGSHEDLVLAARALGTVLGPMPSERLQKLLSHPDVEVRRAALTSATRRPRRELLSAILPLLLEADLSYEARRALVALGDHAVPALELFLLGEKGPRAQALAARVLADVATPRAVSSLMKLVRSSDLALRHLGLQSASRARVQSGNAVLPQTMAHKLFLRELQEYRTWIRPATFLREHPSPEIRLLADSYREFAEMALERGFRALACWYDPRPLGGAFERLRSPTNEESAPALEYLSHVLPRGVFRPVSRMFEEPAPADGEEDSGEGVLLADSIARAWQTGDAWLRACAVRASRFAPTFDPYLFVTGNGDNPIVGAELQALLAGGGRLPVVPPPGGPASTPA